MTKDEADELILKIRDEMYEEIVRYVWKYCQEEELVKDIVQEIFLEVCRHVDTLESHECYRGWVYKTAKNKIMKITDAEKSRNKKQISFNQMTEQEIYVEDTHEFLVFDEYSHLLKKDEMKLLKSHYHDREKLSEIVEVTGKSEAACKMKLKRIRDVIKKHLENE